jgi:hypothetical protein
MNAYHGRPMTLGNAAAARVRLIVWCRDCRDAVLVYAKRLRSPESEP